MPQIKARTRHLRRIAPLVMWSGLRRKSVRLTRHCPAMVIQGPPSWKRGIVRPAQPRTSKQNAARAWWLAMEEFDRLPLVLKAGDVEDPDGDYGGVGALSSLGMNQMSRH
eukprot:scaffold45196_cov29-Phaeocystis_antarctica.AAC.3